MYLSFTLRSQHKRYTRSIIILCSLWAYLSGCGTPTLTADPPLPGDCDRDGEVTAVDGACIVQCDLGMPPQGADCEVAADCNCDGNVDAADPLCATIRATGGTPVGFCEGDIPPSE